MIDSKGVITLAQSIHQLLNLSELKLEVTARDDGSCCPPPKVQLSNRTTVTVQIIGVNTQPTFPGCHNFSPKVRERAPVNTTVLEVCSAHLITVSVVEKCNVRENCSVY